MAKARKQRLCGRITLDGELRRMARGSNDAMDRHYLLWAAKVIKADRLSSSKTERPDILELERMYRLDDLR